MVVLRDSLGNEHELSGKDFPFTELCDTDGNLVFVIVRCPNDGTYTRIEAGTPEAHRYTGMTGKSWSKEDKRKVHVKVH